VLEVDALSACDLSGHAEGEALVAQQLLADALGHRKGDQVARFAGALFLLQGKGCDEGRVQKFNPGTQFLVGTAAHSVHEALHVRRVGRRQVGQVVQGHSGLGRGGTRRRRRQTRVLRGRKRRRLGF